MFNLIKAVIKWFSQWFKSNVTNDVGYTLEDLQVDTKVYRMNREQRRALVRILQRHPDHVSIKCTDIPTEMNYTEYSYWSNLAEDIVNNKMANMMSTQNKTQGK